MQPFFGLSQIGDEPHPITGVLQLRQQRRFFIGRDQKYFRQRCQPGAGSRLLAQGHALFGDQAVMQGIDERRQPLSVRVLRHAASRQTASDVMLQLCDKLEKLTVILVLRELHHVLRQTAHHREGFRVPFDVEQLLP